MCLVYIAEAHASDEWPLGGLCSQQQPRSTAERVSVAQARLSELGITTGPTLVDTAEEIFSKTYAAWPIRWFWLHGRIITSIAQPCNGGVGGYPIDALYSSVAEVLGTSPHA